MTVLWTNDTVIFTDGDVVWKPHETDVQAISVSTSSLSGALDSQPGLAGSAAGVSGVSGSLNILTELPASAAGVSGVSGSLNILTELPAFAVGVSGADGSLNVLWVFQGSAAGVSGVLGSLNVLWVFQGSAAGVSGVVGSLDSQSELIGSAAEVFGIEGSLDSQPGCISSAAGVFGTEGSLLVLTELQGSAAGVFGAEGILNVTTELGSSIVETSGVGGALGVLDVSTLLVGSSVGASGAEGWLGFWIFVDGEIAEISGASGSLDSQPGCESPTVGTSGVSGFLNVVPDFEATTLFWRPENGILETLEWHTSILKAHDGSEQRIKSRQTPRQYFRLQLVLESNKINTWFDSVIHTWQKLAWLIPIWTEYAEHSGDIDYHDNITELIVDTTNADFRNEGKAIVWKSATEYEVVAINTKTDSQLNLSYSMLNSFTGDKYIIPVRTAYLVSSSKKERYNSEISVVDLIFAVYDNIEISNHIPSMIYDGYEVLSIPAFMDATHLEDSDGDIYITDFNAGIFKSESDSNFNFLSQNHNFFNDTKAACWDFRKFLHSLNGKQKTILIPTFRDDVDQRVTKDIEPTDISVKIDNIKLAENMGFNSLRTYIGFYFPVTGVLIVRKITAIAEIDSNEEQITFNTNLGLLNAVEKGDCKICFVDKCRLASDRVEIQWPYAHRNECRTNFMRVHNG